MERCCVYDSVGWAAFFSQLNNILALGMLAINQGTFHGQLGMAAINQGTFHGQLEMTAINHRL